MDCRYKFALEHPAVQDTKRLEKLIKHNDAYYALKRVGEVYQPLTSGMPTVTHVISYIMSGLIKDDLVEQLIQSFQDTSEAVRSDSMSINVICITSKYARMFNQMIAREDSVTERTVSVDILYTDDPNFTEDSLPLVTNEAEYDALLKGKYYFDPEHCYFISESMMELEGRHVNSVKDYMIYLPNSAFRKSDAEKGSCSYESLF